MKNETLYTIKEIVDRKLLGYKERTIRQLVYDKKLDSIDISPKGSLRGSIRISESAIEKFLQSRTRARK